MRVLVDGGNSGSGGYLRYLSGILGSGGLDGLEMLLVCSPRLSAELGPLDPQVTLRVEAQLDAPRRWTRLAWWRSCWPLVVAEFHPDVVLHPNGIVRGGTGAVPKVAIHHSMAPFVWSFYRSYGVSRMSAEIFLSRTRLLRSFRKADGVIFQSEYTRNAITRQGRGIARSAVVPNAVSSSFAAASRPDRTSLSDPVRLLCVSTLHLYKHQWHVVAAVAALRQDLGLDLHLELVGGGDPQARHRLAVSIDEHSANRWTTIREVSAAAMPEVHQTADLFVFASSIETWPITLMEAMASGLPIACSDRMTMPDILRDAGTYFNPEDPASIADALRPLLTDAGLRRRCGSLARQYAHDYTWKNSAAGVVEFLRRVERETR